MAIYKAGQIVRKGKRLSMVEASPDDPIYKRGFVIGKAVKRKSSEPSPETNFKNESKKP